ncbi:MULTISPECIES: hypothetical protein [unclassified Nostoc]|nr:MULTISPECIES: hypothetical protein [unclassified Nostoc]
MAFLPGLDIGVAAVTNLHSWLVCFAAMSDTLAESLRERYNKYLHQLIFY